MVRCERASPRGPAAPHNRSCTKMLIKKFSDKTQTLASDAWFHYFNFRRSNVRPSAFPFSYGVRGPALATRRYVSVDHRYGNTLFIFPLLMLVLL